MFLKIRFSAAILTVVTLSVSKRFSKRRGEARRPISARPTRPVITLPVRLTCFTIAFQQRAANLARTTDDEQNLRHYEVQKNTDGNVFKTAGIVFSGEKQGNSYQFRDKDINSDTTVYYYRIMALFYNEAATFSAVRTISLQDGNAFVDIRAIPNLAKDRLSEVLSALRANKEVCIELYNVSGVRLQATVINSSQQTAFVDVTGLPKGMYLLKSCNRLEIAKERIIKNKICINVFD